MCKPSQRHAGTIQIVTMPPCKEPKKQWKGDSLQVAEGDPEPVPWLHTFSFQNWYIVIFCSFKTQGLWNCKKKVQKLTSILQSLFFSLKNVSFLILLFQFTLRHFLEFNHYYEIVIFHVKHYYWGRYYLLLLVFLSRYSKSNCYQ